MKNPPPLTPLQKMSQIWFGTSYAILQWHYHPSVGEIKDDFLTII